MLHHNKGYLRVHIRDIPNFFNMSCIVVKFHSDILQMNLFQIF